MEALPKNRTITFVGKETKTRTELVLPMTDICFELLTNYKIEQKKTYSGRYLFPDKDGPIKKSCASSYVAKLSKGKWSCHDYRKLARSMWRKLKIDYVVSESLLNHKLHGNDAAYNEDLDGTETGEALRVWHEYLFSKNIK